MKKVHTTNTVFSSQSELLFHKEVYVSSKQTEQFYTRVCPSAPDTRLLSTSPAAVCNRCCSQLTFLSQSGNSSRLGEAALCG